MIKIEKKKHKYRSMGAHDTQNVQCLSKKFEGEILKCKRLGESGLTLYMDNPLF